MAVCYNESIQEKFEKSKTWRDFVEKEARFRNKITCFTFVFSVLVVWVHCTNGEVFLGKSPDLEKVAAFERFLGNTVAQIAVPGFFMMSGYLFYRNFSWGNLEKKWESRIKSVLIPFLLWNFIYYLGYVIGSRLPVVTDIVGKGKVPFNWYTAVDAVLHYSYNYVFWYLYQLILLIILAPVIYGVLKCRVLGCAVLISLFYLVQRGAMIPVLNLDALFYYGLAAFWGIHGTECVEGSWSWKKGLAGAGAAVGAIALPIMFQSEGIGAKVWYRAMMPQGLWLMANPDWLPGAKGWMKYNFFLYATHFALVRLINKTAARVLPGYWLFPVALFLVMPGIMVWFSSRWGAWLKRRLPRLWMLLNGGR